MTIGKKIILAFGIPVGFTVAVCGLSIGLMRELNGGVQQMARDSAGVIEESVAKATAEESASAAHEMNAQADVPRRIVGELITLCDG